MLQIECLVLKYLKWISFSGINNIVAMLPKFTCSFKESSWEVSNVKDDFNTQN